MTTTSRIALTAGLLALATGCSATRQGYSSDDSITPAPRARLSENAIPVSELRATRQVTVFDAVNRIRPRMLTRRAEPAIGDPYEGRPVVYLDGQKQGAVEMLRNIPIDVVVEIAYVTANAASYRFGAYHPGGVIAVRTK